MTTKREIRDLVSGNKRSIAGGETVLVCTRNPMGKQAFSACSRFEAEEVASEQGISVRAVTVDEWASKHPGQKAFVTDGFTNIWWESALVPKEGAA